MRLSSDHLRNLSLWIAVFASLALCGCGDWCFSGDINRGSGGSNQTTVGSNCWSTQWNGAVEATALKSPVCNGCTSANYVQHVFITMRGIQLHANTMNVPGDADWIELAPQLANLPRQIDLIGDSSSEILAENAHVPAGYYREIRLQFLEDSPAIAGGFTSENACGKAGWNCVVHADGAVEALRWPGDAPELVIPLESIHSNSMVVLANTQTHLQLKLELRSEFFFSQGRGWSVEQVLVGRTAATEVQSLEAESSTP
jgi:Domain of unknown function (DUF4382)